MIFNFNQIRSDLSGASINGVTLSLRRESAAHGTSGSATVTVQSHGATSIIGSWTGTGIIAQEQFSIPLGQTVTKSLPNAVAQGFQNGSINGLAVSTTNTNITHYARLEASGTVMNITYTK